MALVGAGFLGHALASYGGFRPRGFYIRWILITTPPIGKIGGVRVQDVAELEATLARECSAGHHRRAGSAAQEIAGKLIDAGVRAI